MLRSRFQSLPGVFNDRLIPKDRPERKKGLKAALSRKFDEVILCLNMKTFLTLALWLEF